MAEIGKNNSVSIEKWEGVGVALKLKLRHSKKYSMQNAEIYLA